MAFNTGNAVGSTDPRDFSDNSENFDRFANGQDPAYSDRIGNQRKSIAGMESEFAAFIAASGYEFVGDYAAGITITGYQQVVRDASGEFWRVDGAASLPYTTTGAGLPEGGAFVTAGDAALRQDLNGSVASGLGATLVNGATIYVGSVAELEALPSPIANQQADVQGVPFIYTGSAWEPSGGFISVNIFGAVGDGVTDDVAAFEAARDYAVLHRVELKAPSAVYALGSTLNLIGLQGFRFIGQTNGYSNQTATFKWIGSAGGTMVLLRSTAFSDIGGFHFDGNDLAAIGIDYTVDSSTDGSVSTQNKLFSMQFDNFTNGVGRCMQIGATVSDQVDNTVIEEINIGNCVTGFYMQGIQTINIWFSHISSSGSGSITNSLFDIQQGGCSIKGLFGGSALSSATNNVFKVAPAVLFVYVDDFEIEHSGQNPVIHLTPDSGSADRMRSFTNGRILWGGPDNGDVILVEHACTLRQDVMVNTFDSSSNCNIRIEPNLNLVNLDESGSRYATGPGLVSRVYSNVVGGGVGASRNSLDTTSSVAMNLNSSTPDGSTNHLAILNRESAAGTSRLWWSAGNSAGEGGIGGTPGIQGSLTLFSSGGGTPTEVARIHGGSTPGFSIGDDKKKILAVDQITALGLDFDLTGVVYQDIDVAFPGAGFGDIVSLGVPAGMTGAVNYTAWVKQSDIVTVRAFRADSNTGANPPSGAMRIMVTKF